MDPDTCNNSFFLSVIACATHASIVYYKIIPTIFKSQRVNKIKFHKLNNLTNLKIPKIQQIKFHANILYILCCIDFTGRGETKIWLILYNILLSERVDFCLAEN